MPNLVITSPHEVGQIVAVFLDGKPLASSGRILLQLMSEEKASGFTTEPAGSGKQKITSTGIDPWLVRVIAGEVHFTRPDAAELPVTPLNGNGTPLDKMGNADRILPQPGGGILHHQRMSGDQPRRLPAT